MLQIFWICISHVLSYKGMEWKIILYLALSVVLCEVSCSPMSVFPEDDPTYLRHEYESLKTTLINDYGYSREFADLVETNLKLAIKEERQRQQNNVFDLDEISSSTSASLRQNPNQGSEEYDDDTTIGITTPRASPGDIVRGIAQLVTGLGTFNLNTFWGSFVNFFPPGQRESAQALVDGALGRRPQQWPTLPTTTTQLTTSTKDEYDLESEETTKAAAVTVASAVQGATVAYAVEAPAQTAVTAAAAITAYIPGSELPPLPPTRATTTKYAVRRRIATPSASVGDEGLTLNEEEYLVGKGVPEEVEIVMPTTEETMNSTIAIIV